MNVADLTDKQIKEILVSNKGKFIDNKSPKEIEELKNAALNEFARRAQIRANKFWAQEALDQIFGAEG